MSANSADSCTALSGVRLTTSNCDGFSRSNGSSTPRAAPPAPSTSTRRPWTAQPRFTIMSRTRPMPSVLSPSISPPAQGVRVLTAPARRARSLSRSAKAKASCLNGTVTLRPAPPSSKNLRAACSNPSRRTSTARYCNCCPHCAAKAACIAGDLLCLIGLPNTAYLSIPLIYRCSFV